MQVIRRYPLTQAPFPALWMRSVALALLVTGCASTARVQKGLVEIHGVIRDREGAGIQGIYVYVDNWALGPPTDVHGRFRTRARPGPHRILLGGPGIPVPDANLDTLLVGTSATRLDYQYRGLKVQGRLVGPGGRVIREGVVQAFGNSPETREAIDVSSWLKRGRYVLFVPRGTYYFKTEPLPEYYPATDHCCRPPAIRIEADTTIDFSAAGHLVDGRISVRGKPLSRGTVQVYGVAWPDTLETRASSTTTPNGRYQLFVPNGSYTFFIHRGSYLSPFGRRWFKQEISGPERIETNLAMTFWSGVVRDSATGTPIESVWVWAGDPHDRGYPSSSYGAASISDRKGRFRMELEPRRTYSLFWSKGRIVPRRFATAAAGNDSVLEVHVPLSVR